MDQEDSDSTNDLHRELAVLESNTSLSDKEAEERFIIWYEEICKERMTMLEAEESYKQKIDELETAEEGYRTRIKDLENSTITLVKTFEEAQSEIKVLREKYEATSKDSNYTEPYNVVCRERDKLLQVEIQHKKEIKEFEDEVDKLRKCKNEFVNFDVHNKDKTKTRESFGKLVVITSTERLKTLERENDILKYMVNKLERKNKSLSSKLKLLETRTQQVETVTLKRQTSIQAAKEKIVINKKCIPTFLPRIQNVPSGFVQDNERSRYVSFVPGQSQTPILRYGLGYGELHNKRVLKRHTSRDDSTLSSSRFESISKYII